MPRTIAALFPDGRIGSDPNHATPEHGKRFYDTAVEEVARDYEAWVARYAPSDRERPAR